MLRLFNQLESKTQEYRSVNLALSRIHVVDRTHGEQIRDQMIPTLVILLHLFQRTRRDPGTMEFTLILWLRAVRNEGDDVEHRPALDGECEDVLVAQKATRANKSCLRERSEETR